jgi:hypothetical protein
MTVQVRLGSRARAKPSTLTALLRPHVNANASRCAPVMDLASVLNNNTIDLADTPSALLEVLRVPAVYRDQLPDTALSAPRFAQEPALAQDEGLIFADPTRGFSRTPSNGDPLDLAAHPLPTQRWIKAALDGLDVQYKRGVRFTSFADPCCKHIFWPLWVLQWWDDYSQLLPRHTRWKQIIASMSVYTPADSADVRAARELLERLSIGERVTALGSVMIVDDFQRLLADGSLAGRLSDGINDTMLAYLETRIDCEARGVIFARRELFDKLRKKLYDDPVVIQCEALIKRDTRPRTHLISVVHVEPTNGVGHWVPFRLGFGKRMYVEYGKRISSPC